MENYMPVYKIYGDAVIRMEGDIIYINPIYRREQILEELRKEKIGEKEYSLLEKKLIEDDI